MHGGFNMYLDKCIAPKQLELLLERDLVYTDRVSNGNTIREVLKELKYMTGIRDLTLITRSFLENRVSDRYCEFIVRLYFADMQENRKNSMMRVYNEENIRNFIALLNEDSWDSIKERVDNVLNYTDKPFSDIVTRRVIKGESVKDIMADYDLNPSIVNMLVNATFKCYAKSGYKRYIIECRDSGFGMVTPLVFLNLSNYDVVLRMGKRGFYTVEKLTSVVNNEVVDNKVEGLRNLAIKLGIAKHDISVFIKDLADLGFITIDENGVGFKSHNLFEIVDKTIEDESKDESESNSTDNKLVYVAEEGKAIEQMKTVSVNIRGNTWRECQTKLVDIMDMMTCENFRLMSAVSSEDESGPLVVVEFSYE